MKPFEGKDSSEGVIETEVNAFENCGTSRVERSAASVARDHILRSHCAKDNSTPINEWSVDVPGCEDATGHYRRAFSLDMSALALGRKPGNVPGFRGRPTMARSVIVSLRSLIGSRSPTRAALHGWLQAMGHLWKSLDAFETETRSSIDDIAMLIGAPWLAFSFAMAARGEKFANRIYYVCGKTLDKAFELSGSSDRISNSPFSQKGRPESRNAERPYSRDVERSMLDAFRADRKGVEERIAESYRIAETGDPTTESRYVRNCRGGVVLPTIWKRPEILRFARDELLATLPDKTAFRAKYGFKHDVIGCPPKAPVPVALAGEAVKKFQRGLGIGLAALYRNFVPVERDIVPFLCELAFFDGWNLETIRDLDRNDWYDGDPEDGTVYIFSRKMRAAGDTMTIRSGTGPDTPYAIINSALAITAPLHDWVKRRIVVLDAMDRTPAVTREMEKLAEIVDRVWLLLRLDKTGVDAITVECHSFWHSANEVLQRRGVQENGEPCRWSGRRLRNRVAYDVFEISDFDIESLCTSLGHADIATSDGYLDHPDTDEFETGLIRARLDDLAARRGWPEALPERPISLPSTLRLLVTLEGRSWLASMNADEPSPDPVRAFAGSAS